MNNINKESHLRIATLANTGDEYIVLRIDFRDQLVFCVGEILATDGNRVRKVGAGKSFALADVVLRGNVCRNEPLLGKLFRQAVRNAPGEYTITETASGNVYADLVEAK